MIHRRFNGIRRFILCLVAVFIGIGTIDAQEADPDTTNQAIVLLRDGRRLEGVLDTIKDSGSAWGSWGFYYPHSRGTLLFWPEGTLQCTSDHRSYPRGARVKISDVYSLAFLRQTGTCNGSLVKVTFTSGKTVNRSLISRYMSFGGTWIYSSTYKDILELDIEDKSVEILLRDVSEIRFPNRAMTTNLLVVRGTVLNGDGKPAGAGLNVAAMLGDLFQNAITEANGNYAITFLAPLNALAATGDTVEVTVSPQNGESVHAAVTLTAEEIAEKSVTIDVSLPLTEPTFDLFIPEGISLIHIPLKVASIDEKATTIDTVGDFYDALGGQSAVKLLITYDPATDTWRSFLGQQSRATEADRKITPDMGVITFMRDSTTLRLKGDAWGNEGKSRITLQGGTNLVGVVLYM